MNVIGFRQLEVDFVVNQGGIWCDDRAPFRSVILTIEFGRMYEKMKREWCEYCIRELEGLRHAKSGQGHNGNMGADTKEGE